MLLFCQVKIWFQNRRNKWKRQIAADSEASNLRAFPGVPLFLQVVHLNSINIKKTWEFYLLKRLS